MKLIQKINYSLIGCHGLTDFFLPDFYKYYIFFPLFFLFLQDNLIYFILITKSILHFSSDLIFLPNPLPYIILSIGIIVGYYYRKNQITLNTVQLYLCFHSGNHIIRNDLNNYKILLLVLGFIFILYNPYLLNSIDSLINNVDEPMNLKKKLFYSLLAAHITTNYSSFLYPITPQAILFPAFPVLRLSICFSSSIILLFLSIPPFPKSSSS